MSIAHCRKCNQDYAGYSLPISVLVANTLEERLSHGDSECARVFDRLCQSW